MDWFSVWFLHGSNLQTSVCSSNCVQICLKKIFEKHRKLKKGTNKFPEMSKLQPKIQPNDKTTIKELVQKVKGIRHHRVCTMHLPLREPYMAIVLNKEEVHTLRSCIEKSLNFADDHHKEHSFLRSVLWSD